MIHASIRYYMFFWTLSRGLAPPRPHASTLSELSYGRLIVFVRTVVDWGTRSHQSAAGRPPESPRDRRCRGGYVHRRLVTPSPVLVPQSCACSPAGGARHPADEVRTAVATRVPRRTAGAYTRTP